MTEKILIIGDDFESESVTPQQFQKMSTIIIENKAKKK